MASYAPLFAHVDGWQWTPDLIWVDNLRSAGTVNYQVQKLFSLNKGTNVIPALLNNKPVSGQDSLYVSAVTDSKTKEIIIKIVNGAATAKQNILLFEGVKKLAAQGTITTLTGNADQINTVTNPFAVMPEVSSIIIKGKKLAVTVPPLSLSVIKIAMQ